MRRHCISLRTSIVFVTALVYDITVYEVSGHVVHPKGLGLSYILCILVDFEFLINFGKIQLRVRVY